MNREVIGYEKIYDFPFEGLIFTPCLKNGRVLDGASEIHYKNGEFISFPFDEDLDNIKIFKNYIIRYK